MSNNSPEPLRTVFTKNRTEELGNDVWRHFVVPPFYNHLDLVQARKPRIIIGGRGCGKTMLLLYLSYHSAFSPDRNRIPSEALEHVGLYWRADTQFSNMMTGRNLAQDTWNQAFNHLLALMVTSELLDSVRSICQQRVVDFPIENLETMRTSALSVYDAQFGVDYRSFRDHIQFKLSEFEHWVANINKIQEPVFLSGKNFVLAVIREFVKQIPALAQATFSVYIDEYENLLDYQQQIINTCLKHSQSPLIFNVAIKRNGFRTSKTVGEESLIDVADYRTHDIEEYLSEGFDLFAAEVLLLTLNLAGWSVPIDIQKLRDPAQIEARRSTEYKDKVLTFVRHTFPGLSQEELAKSVFTDNAILNRLIKTTERALRERSSTIAVDRFVRSQIPQASIVASALLFRKNLKPDKIVAELDAYEIGEPNKFDGSTDWVQNNLIGCILALYEPSSRVCPFYAGFDTFTVMAKGNLRHFLELCHQSLSDIDVTSGLPSVVVDPKKQAQAARLTSTAFLRQIRSFGRLGNRLHAFVLRLGSLFALAHQRPTQSEPEQSHFSINRGNKTLSEEDLQFIAEAVKWSVLFEEEITKVKESEAVQTFEYILNPIYAPYFNITYRKKRRLELSVDEFQVLAQGSYNDVNALLKRFSSKWAVSLEEANPNLFSHLLSD